MKSKFDLESARNGVPMEFLMHSESDEWWPCRFIGVSTSGLIVVVESDQWGIFNLKIDDVRMLPPLIKYRIAIMYDSTKRIRAVTVGDEMSLGFTMTSGNFIEMADDGWQSYKLRGVLNGN